MTDGLRNFMYTKHNEENAKLKLDSHLPKTFVLFASLKTF